MLHTITWQHYLLYVVIALLIWYSVILWIYFRDEAKLLLDGSKKQLIENDDFSEVNEHKDDFLGEPSEEYGVSTVGSQGISFGVRLPEDANAYPFSQEEALQGLVPDVLEEIKEVIHTIEVEKGDKEDFKSLFKLVSSKYQQLVASGYLDAINKIISETAPFNLSDEELKQLWE